MSNPFICISLGTDKEYGNVENVKLGLPEYKGNSRQ